MWQRLPELAMARAAASADLPSAKLTRMAGDKSSDATAPGATRGEESFEVTLVTPYGPRTMRARTEDPVLIFEACIAQNLITSDQSPTIQNRLAARR
jgi:hypothetical protein